MYAKQYQNLAARTINKDLKPHEMVDHSLKGMCAELGELQGLYQKIYQGHELDEAHVKKELGDLLWFVAEFCTANEWDLGEIMMMNIDKLKSRYPQGFDSEHSLNRAEGDI